MKQPLVEGVDFYMDGGKFVFSEVYHLKRGYCCNSKCRHCPFPKPGGAQPSDSTEKEPLLIVLPKITSR